MSAAKLLATVLAAGALTTPSAAPGQTITTLYAFRGTVHGYSPNGALIFQSGLLYGITFYGGTGGYGTVYQLLTRLTNT